MLNCPWYMAHDACNCCFSFCTIFSPFTPLTAQKNKISKKWKKIPGDTIILHMCTTNYDKMMYGSWDMVGHRWTGGKSDIRRWHMPHLKKLKYQVMIYYKNFIKSTLLVIGPKDFSERGRETGIFCLPH